LSLPVAVADCYQAVFLNSVLPAGVLGDVHRAVSHGRRAGNVGRGVRAVVLERMCGQVVLVVVAAGVLLAHPGVLAAVVGSVPGSGGTGGMLAVAVPVGLAVAVPSLRRARAARNQGARRTGPASTIRSALGIWPGVVLLSLAATVGYLVLFVVAARAAGSHATLGELVPVLVLGLLAMGLPVNVGGWGPREAVTTVAFGAVGFATTQGLTAAVVYGVLSLIGCLPGLGVLLLRRRGWSKYLVRAVQRPIS
jgi:glycosyltransferase 2 family protein